MMRLMKPATCYLDWFAAEAATVIRAGISPTPGLWFSCVSSPGVVEGLHYAAYKNTLCNSLYCPDHMVGNIESEHVSIFPIVKSNVFVGHIVNKSFSSPCSCTTLYRTISQAQEWHLLDLVWKHLLLFCIRWHKWDFESIMTLKAQHVTVVVSQFIKWVHCDNLMPAQV